jgi:hypothetical protein
MVDSFFERYVQVIKNECPRVGDVETTDIFATEELLCFRITFTFHL